MTIHIAGQRMFEGRVVSVKPGRALCWVNPKQMVIALLPPDAQAETDAPEPVRRQAAELMRKYQSWAQKPTRVERGCEVEVVRGRKVPRGTKGRVFWLGDGQFGMRVGFKTEQDETFFTALSNVELVEEPAPCEVEERDFRAQVAPPRPAPRPETQTEFLLRRYNAMVDAGAPPESIIPRADREMDPVDVVAERTERAEAVGESAQEPPDGRASAHEPPPELFEGEGGNRKVTIRPRAPDGTVLTVTPPRPAVSPALEWVRKVTIRKEAP